MSDDSTNLRQEFVTELESILESDEAYGSNLQILTYALKEDVINGKFKDSWNNRVYEFIIDIDGISYKPAAKLDSFGADELPTRFDAYSKGYASLFENERLDRNPVGKRVKKPKCGNQGYGCGYSCISLLKTCRILSSGKKTRGEQQGKAIGKERLNKLILMSGKLYATGSKGGAVLASVTANKVTEARNKKAGQLREVRKGIDPQQKVNQQTSKSKLEGVHDVIPLLSESSKSNFKNPEIIDKISLLTGMSKSQSLESATAINRFSQSDYEDIRDAEYQGIETPQIVAINRYLDKMPKFKGEVFRGKKFKTEEDLNNFVEKLKNGYSYELPAMSSFSSNQDIASDFAVNVNSYSSVIFKIADNKSGVTIKNLSTHAKEDEVLVKKGAKYKINGEIETIDRSGKKITIISLKEY